jgi:hypothetical protein
MAAASDDFIIAGADDGIIVLAEDGIIAGTEDEDDAPVPVPSDAGEHAARRTPMAARATAGLIRECLDMKKRKELERRENTELSRMVKDTAYILRGD